MGSKFFGEYLIEKGIITRDALLQATQHQQSIKRPLIATAIEKGFLNEEHLAALDGGGTAGAGSTPPALVGLEGGEMTLTENAQPHDGMSENGLLLAEALAQGGHIPLTALPHLFAEYKQEILAPDQQFWLYQHMRARILPNVAHKDIVSILLQVSIDTFVEYVHQPVEVGEFEEDTDLRTEVDYIFTQQVFGDQKMFFALLLSEAITLAIGSYVMGKLCNEVDELVLDAVAEYHNIVLGKALGRLSAKGCKLQAKAPTITPKDKMARVIPCSSTLAIKLHTPIDDFFIMFFFEDRKDFPAYVWGKDTEGARPDTPAVKTAGKIRLSLKPPSG